MYTNGDDRLTICATGADTSGGGINTITGSYESSAAQNYVFTRPDNSVGAAGGDARGSSHLDLYFTVPGGLSGLLRYRSNIRENPLAWNNYIDTTLEYNIVLPDGYEPVLLPADFSWQAPAGAGLVEVAVQYSPRANAIRMVQIADLNPALIPAKDFPNIIEASRILAHPDMRTILLKKKQVAE